MGKHLATTIRVAIEKDNPSICRDEEKCIKCGSCKNYMYRLYRCKWSLFFGKN